MSLVENEEKEIYSVINDALLSLCEEKPNDPVDFLSRKMLELIGEDPTKAVRKKEEVIEDKQTDHVIISPEKYALKNFHQNFYELYKIIEEISLNTYLIEDLKLGNTYGQKCVRIVDKSISPVLMSDRKIKMLINISYPNIIKIFQILEDEKYFYIVHDYCPGRDLFTYLYNNKENVTESLIRIAITQILSSLSYLHKLEIIHKNLNPSKILVYNQEFDPHDIVIKISDFINNTEAYSKKSYIYKGYCNTIEDPLYLAPEFIQGKYNNKVDIWSVGILCYLLFVGEPPFKGSKSDIIYQLSQGKITYPPNLNNYKKQLLKKMLTFNPNERPEAEELLKEEYFKVDIAELTSALGLEPGSVTGSPNCIGSGSDEGKNDEKDLKDVLTGFSAFTVGKNLRRSVLSYIVSRKLYQEGDKKIRKIFERLDTDHSGTIETAEIFKEYRKFFPGATTRDWKTIEAFIEATDANKNGKVDYSEFLTAMSLGRKEMSKKTLKDIFDYYDQNKNGTIEATDIKELFEDTGLSDKQIHEMLDDVDLNGDREISFDEFYKLITAKQ